MTVRFDITFDVFFESFGILVTPDAVAFLSKIIGSWLFALPTR